MNLKFHPKPGMVLICDFSTGFQAPEMIKKRPVVVVSPRSRSNDKLCTIVPLSTTEPKPIELHHHCLDSKSLPGKFADQKTWAKCDMINRVSLKRLDRVYLGKTQNGKRQYISQTILQEDFQAIQRCILQALGLASLTKYL